MKEMQWNEKWKEEENWEKKLNTYKIMKIEIETKERKIESESVFLHFTNQFRT